MLSFENIVINKGDNLLLSGLSLSILPGAILCIHGHNGTGKTSLLRALAGMANYKGKIYYNGYDIDNVLQDYTAIISYVGHHNALDEECTVLENLLFWAAIRNMGSAVTASLAVFALESRAHHIVRSLSQGFKRKVELTKLLLTQTAIWFLDEPFANLDSIGEARLLEMMKVRSMNQGMVIFTAQAPYKSEKFAIDNISLSDYRHE